MNAREAIDELRKAKLILQFGEVAPTVLHYADPERIKAAFDFAMQHLDECLTPGWICPNVACGVFNGDVKEHRTTCRSCETPRPNCEPAR